MNRYLVTATGRPLKSRWAPGLLVSSPFLGGAIWIGLGLLFPEHKTLFWVTGALAAIIFVVGSAASLWCIARSRRELKAGHAAWVAGQTEKAIGHAHFPLAWVFRRDLRTAAFHLLGLSAEARGDFHAAEELFVLAKATTPTTRTVALHLRAKIFALFEAHLALNAAAMGHTDAAQAAIARGWREARRANLPSFSFDRHLDVVETGRDPRGLLLLAGALAAYRDGASAAAVEIGGRMHDWLRTLLPREAALFHVVLARATARPSHEQSAADPWVARALEAAARR